MTDQKLTQTQRLPGAADLASVGSSHTGRVAGWPPSHTTGWSTTLSSYVTKPPHDRNVGLICFNIFHILQKVGGPDIFVLHRMGWDDGCREILEEQAWPEGKADALSLAMADYEA